MRLTKEQLKQIISEEIKTLLTESVDLKPEDVIGNWNHIYEEGFGDWPFLVNGETVVDGNNADAGGDLLEAVGAEDPELLEQIETLIEAAGAESLYDALATNPGGMAANILAVFDVVPSITSYPSGDLMLGDIDTYITLSYNSGPGEVQAESPSDEVIEIKVGWGETEREFKNNLGWIHGTLEHAGIIEDFDEGSAGWGNQDIQSTIDLNLKKLLSLVNDPNSEFVLEINPEEETYSIAIKR